MAPFEPTRAVLGGLSVLTLLAVLWPSDAAAAVCPETDSVDLLAGQDIDVGDVSVCNDDTRLFVTYDVEFPEWCLLETHLHVATSVGGIPQTRNGNPIPGRFDHGDEYDPCVGTDTFEILLDDIDDVDFGDTVVIAAHADVEDQFFNEEGAWGDGVRFVDRGPWAMFFTDVLEEPACEGADSCTVFVTSRIFTGDLVSEAETLTGVRPASGLAGGDAICQHLADAEFSLAATGTYKAWLSTSAGSPNTRFVQADVPYRLVTETQIAENYTALTSTAATPLDHAIDVTEGGASGVRESVWTGTDESGNLRAPSCAGWSSDQPGPGGPGGRNGQTDLQTRAWTFAAIQSCDDQIRLYCFQQ